MGDMELYSAGQRDYLREVMNVAAGNALPALAQIFGVDVNLKIPLVHFLPIKAALPAMADSVAVVTAVKMRMSGDLQGDIFYVVSEQDIEFLVGLMEAAAAGGEAAGSGVSNMELVAEVGNMLAGAYLVGLHDFCGLNVLHGLPISAKDMFQALVDQSIAVSALQVGFAILVENEFIIHDEKIKAYLLLVPDRVSVDRIMESLEVARRVAYGLE